MEKPIGFKFRSIDKRLIESLITGEVYFSPAAMLNDPFDCQVDIKKSLSSAIDKVHGNQKKVLQSIQQKLDGIFSEVSRDIQDFGVWSCSMELDNSLLWAHYGNEHRGICLAYELPDKFIDHSLGDVMGIHPVEYAKNPISNWFIDNSNIVGSPPPLGDFITSLVVKLLISKDECWSYEKESRVISKSHGLKEIGKEALKQVCFGIRTTESDKKLVRHILDNHGYDVTLCEMTRTENDFGLRAKEI